MHARLVRSIVEHRLQFAQRFERAPLGEQLLGPAEGLERAHGPANATHTEPVPPTAVRMAARTASDTGFRLSRIGYRRLPFAHVRAGDGELQRASTGGTGAWLGSGGSVLHAGTGSARGGHRAGRRP